MAFEDAVTAAINTAVATIEPDTSSETNEAAETPPAESPETPAEEVAETPTVAQPADPSEDDELKAIESELVEKTPGLKQGRINISRHQAVLTRQRRAAEREAKEYQEKIAALEPLKQFNEREWQDRLAAITLAEQNPEVFVKEVLLKDPRYAKQREVFLAKMAADPPPPQTTVTEAPQPDVLLTDGRLTYSPEAAAKFAAWKTEEQAKALAAKYDAALEELRGELKPIKDEREFNTRLSHSMTKMAKKRQNALDNWEGYKEHEDKVYALITAPGNETMGLEEGYIKAVLPLLKPDRQKIRADERASLIKEMNKTPSRSIIPGQVPEAGGDDGSKPRDTTDVIKESMRKAGLS